MIRERALKVVLVLVGLLFYGCYLSPGNVCTGTAGRRNKRGSFADDDEPVFHAWDFLAADRRVTRRRIAE